MISDRIKIFIAVVCFISALILPLLGLLYGWWRADLVLGIVMMVSVFLTMSIFGVIVLFRVNRLTWITISLPYLFGAGYSFLPDAIPISLDDAAVTTSGAILSYILALRKQPNTPKWAFMFLVAAGIYTIFGGLIPGPLDEFLVDFTALLLTWFFANREKALD
jgi:hypothetical protein